MVLTKLASLVRNHPKKSLVGLASVCYGVDYALKRRRDFLLMRDYCKEAEIYGNQSLVSNNNDPDHSISMEAYRVTVILNPASNNGKARKLYENYCQPLLNLAGFKVTIVRTIGGGVAKELMEAMEGADAVLVAGGDGTIMETVTGMLRRKDQDSFCRRVMVGVIPVGRNNHTARSLFPEMQGEPSEVKFLAEATMSVIRNHYRSVDVLEVCNASEEGPFGGRKLHGLRQVQLGSFRDSMSRVNGYWYLPGLKHYLAHIFAYWSASPRIMWSCPGQLSLATNDPPNESKSLIVEETNKNGQSGWKSWMPFMSSATKVEKKNEHKETLPLKWSEPAKCQTSEITIQTANDGRLTQNDPRGQLRLTLAPQDLPLGEFVRECWRRHRNYKDLFSVPNSPENHEVPTKNWRVLEDLGSVRWDPGFVQNSGGFEDDDHDNDHDDSPDLQFYLDDEAVDVIGPIDVSVLPKKIRIFCSESLKVEETSNHDNKYEANKRWWLNNRGRVATNLATSPSLNNNNYNGRGY